MAINEFYSASKIGNLDYFLLVLPCNILIDPIIGENLIKSLMSWISKWSWTFSKRRKWLEKYSMHTHPISNMKKLRISSLSFCLFHPTLKSKHEIGLGIHISSDVILSTQMYWYQIPFLGFPKKRWVLFVCKKIRAFI